MVDDDLVAAIRTKRRLNGLGDGLAGFNVADNGSIFSVVARKALPVSWSSLSGNLSHKALFILLVEDLRGSILSGNRLPLVARLEETGLGRPG
jgi:hypothetical protein